MARSVIFHAWSNGGTPELDRQFVADCLQRAVASLDRPGLEVCEASRELHGTTGPTDVFDTVATQVEAADLVIADISTATAAVGPGGRGAPSAEVMFELGYAIAKKGRAPLIGVANLGHGPVPGLPFELPSAQLITYTLTDSAEREAVRDKLVPALAHAIQICLGDTASERARRFSEGLDALTKLLVYGTDLEDSGDGPSLARDAEDVLALAREVKARLRDQVSPDLGDLLGKAIGTLERTVALPNAESTWSRIRSGLASACSNVELGARDFLKTIPADPTVTRTAIDTARELARWSTDAVTRFEALADDPVPTEELRKFGELTYELRRYAEFPVLPEQPSFVEKLHPITVTIRKALLTTERDRLRSGKALLGCVQLARDELTGLLTAYASALPLPD